MQPQKIQLTKEGLAHHSRYFAIQTNNEAWKLADAAKTDADKEKLMAHAFASLFHWQKSGHASNINMAYVICARALAISGAGELAQSYAEKALAYFETQKDLMLKALCYLTVAHAWAVQGKKRNFKKYVDLAVATSADLDEKQQQAFQTSLDNIEPPA